MQALIDANYLIALANPRDKSHAKCAELARRLQFEFVVPTVIIPEVTHILNDRLGHYAVRGVMAMLLNPFWHFEQLEADDFARSVEVINKYSDAKIDFVDCALVAIAERLKIDTILTLDQSDFRMIRPKHVPHFTILPE